MDGLYKFTKFFSLILSLLIPSLTFAAAPLKPLKIAVIQIIEHPALNSTRKGILDELKSRGYKEGKNLTWIYQSAQGRPVMAAQIAQRFVSQRPDVIVALGTPAAQAAKQATRGTEIPVIFSSITDPLGVHLLKDLKKPDENVTGVSNFIDVKPQLDLFQELLPKLKTLGMIYNPGEDNSVTLVKKVKDTAEQSNLTINAQIADKTSDVVGATRSLIGMVDAIFISNDNTALSAFRAITKVADQKKIPVFASDSDLIDQGALAVLGPNQYELGKQTAILLLKALETKKDLPPVEFPQHIELRVNQEKAKTLGIEISASIAQKVVTPKK